MAEEINNTIAKLEEERRQLEIQSDKLLAAENFKSVKSQFNQIVNRIAAINSNLITYQKLSAQGYSPNQISDIVRDNDLRRQRTIAQQLSAKTARVKVKELKDLSIIKQEQKKGNTFIGYDPRTKQLLFSKKNGILKSNSQEIIKSLRQYNLTPVINNVGEVTGFSSKETKRTYIYNDKGINEYNKALKALSRKIDFKKLAKEYSSTKQSVKPSSKVLQLSQKYKEEIITDKRALERAIKSRELDRLKTLQRKKNLTASEKREKKRLQNSVAKNYQRVSNILLKTVFNTAVDFGYGSVALAKNLKIAPLSTISALPKSVLDGIKADFSRATRGGALEAAQVATEYAVFAGIFKGIGAIAKRTIKVAAKLNPKYVKFIDGEIKFRGRPNLILKKQTVSSGATSLAKQAEIAGKEVTAVNAAADRLTSLIKREKIIRKPIVGEENFPAKIKAVLKKFDSGRKITFKELQTVNTYLRKNVAPNITLLERSLYADPASGIRISRLGIQKPQTATIKDILRGNFRLWQKAQRPQVLIFENAKVAKFPKYLKSIERKLKAGRRLTTTETDRLIQWQIQTGGGKFKPIGSTIYAGGRELEVTLAPGELIKRIKRIGFTYIDGKKVDFILAEVYTPTKTVAKEMKLAHAGKLPIKRLSKLENDLSKNLGRKIKVETPEIRARRVRVNVPVLRIRGKGILVVRLKMLSRKKVIKRKIIRTVPGRKKVSRKVVRKKVVRKTVRRKPVKRTSRPRPRPKPRPRPRPKPRPRPRPKPRPRPRPRRGPPKTPTRTPPPTIKVSQFRKRTLRKAVPTFYVVTKKRGRFVKLYPKPLTLKAARDYAVYSIDNNLTKTAFFVPLGKKRNVVSPPNKISGYASKAGRKVRPYRIRFGKKQQLVNGYIEKRKYFQDTRGEKLQLARLRKKVTRRTIRKRPTPRLKPSKRTTKKRRKPTRPPRKKVIRKKRRINPRK